ncbi:trehalose-phosphatase [Brevibacterium album]|uniref:trehalose-phosphatase n=1 Tax=Brevibacterium album TaxID=417948 RepID=UPI0004101E40|nr:trehalose-phosphatase [Brevibacterium album]
MRTTTPALAPAGLPGGLLVDLAEASRLLGEELFVRLTRLVRAESLLIATDYDGTIAPLVDRPTRAYPLDLNVETMRALAGLPATHSAVISGRSLRDLAAMSRLPREVHLVGSHGGEFGIDDFDDIGPEEEGRLTELRAALLELRRSCPNVFIELKPLGAAVHLRGRAEEERAHITSWVHATAQRLRIAPVTGRDVFDLTVIPASKADALASLQERLRADAVLFIGDDIADEPALSLLREAGEDGSRSLGLRVGTDAGAGTAAHFRVPDPEAVGLVLATVFELRRSWMYGRTSERIERHSMLGNGHSTALVDPTGRICWMPHPLPHSASVFSEILGTPAAGHFSVAPASVGAPAAASATTGSAPRAKNASRPLDQRYRGDTMTVLTRWAGLDVADYLAPVPEDSQETVLMRVLTGDAPAEIRFAPRLDYGAVPTALEVEGSSVRVLGTSEPMTLYAPGVEFSLVEEGGSHTAVATVVPAELPGGRVVMAFACGSDPGAASAAALGDETQVRALAEGFWENWVHTLTLPEHVREGVVRSALTLRALCHAPTGGVLAAATTSLPEGVGGVRNWDYRYCWLRDGSMTVRALLDLGSTGEAEGFVQWLRGILTEAPGPEFLHPLYAVDGSALTSEAVLEHLPGYAGSRPVRVGNAAEHQVQLDVFGPVAELIHDTAAARGAIAEDEWGLLVAMTDAVTARWDEPDHGIWEARRAPKHNVYTKVMCWVTLDRALAVAERFDRVPTGPWRSLRERIAEQVLTRGWSERAGSFTVAYGDDDLDAACLFVGLSGLLPPDDPRFLATVNVVERELREGPTVFRYRYDDGLPGLEGGFHICTTWLIEAFLLTGRTEEARSLFRQLDALRGPTGLLSEEYDPLAEQHLGNHPQAYSHLGYIRVVVLAEQLGVRL